RKFEACVFIRRAFTVSTRRASSPLPPWRQPPAPRADRRRRARPAPGPEGVVRKIGAGSVDSTAEKGCPQDRNHVARVVRKIGAGPEGLSAKPEPRRVSLRPPSV